MAGLTVSVVVPYRSDGGGQRGAVWEWLQAKWRDAHPDWEVVADGCGPGPWVKATAVTAAASRASGDILVVADADVWCDGTAEAVGAVHSGASWAIPHRLVHRLAESSTAQILDGTASIADDHPLAERAYRGHAGGGIVVLRRDTYMQVPLDPRFVGWGQEDDAWAYALSTIAGPPWRGTAPLWHLWHPPQPRRSRQVGTTDGLALLGRYHRARHAPTRMRELIEEAREWEPCASS